MKKEGRKKNRPIDQGKSKFSENFQRNFQRIFSIFNRKDKNNLKHSRPMDNLVSASFNMDIFVLHDFNCAHESV